jgi:hypothetical protein
LSNRKRNFFVRYDSPHLSRRGMPYLTIMYGGETWTVKVKNKPPQYIADKIIKKE